MGIEREYILFRIKINDILDHPPPPHEWKPVQFTVTTLQPLWRETESGFLYGWEYCLPARLWCLIRGRFGVWVICGGITVCDHGRDTHVQVPNVKIRAFDVDWLQDDALGSDITNATGHFRIYYTPQNFRVTPFSPFINFEWVGGPDIYFRVETLLGTALLGDAVPDALFDEVEFCKNSNP